jgi:hypothetical protein
MSDTTIGIRGALPPVPRAPASAKLESAEPAAPQADAVLLGERPITMHTPPFPYPPAPPPNPNPWPWYPAPKPPPWVPPPHPYPKPPKSVFSELQRAPSAPAPKSQPQALPAHQHAL